MPESRQLPEPERPYLDVAMPERIHRAVWGERPDEAGYPPTWGLWFTVYMPTCPTYWGPDADAKTAELCCREGELAIGAFISERWPGSSCEFHRWPNDGGCPRPTVDPEGPQAQELEDWVQRAWPSWASRVIDWGRRSDR